MYFYINKARCNQYLKNIKVSQVLLSKCEV